MSKFETGKFGEDLAVEFLKKKGYKILAQNYRYGHGEIDVIAKDAATIAFVEVKYRKSLKYGRPEEAITQSKLAQVKKIAAAYLYENNISDVECRIDVIAILKKPDGKFKIEHYKNVSII